MADDLISEAAAAAILGVSHQRVIQIRIEGKLEPIKTAGLGRTRIVYRRAEVERRAGSRTLRDGLTEGPIAKDTLVAVCPLC